MGKKKISKKQKRLSKSLKKRKKIRMKPIKLKTKKGISKIDPLKMMVDEKFLMSAILQCFKDNDPEALIEILDGYIIACNKTEFAKKAEISRSTLYDMLHGKKNPTLRVFTQCVYRLVS
jgi:DNA-binding phage protein